jgi:hypothetical protein
MFLGDPYVKERYIHMTKERKQYTLTLPQDLYQQLVDFLTKYNTDPRNIGTLSMNSLPLTAAKQFLLEN